MHISEVAIANYMSFRELPPLRLSPRFNTIVGRNNAGKTSLLRVLSGRFEHQPHRSEKTIPFVGASYNTLSTARVAFTLSQDEFRTIMSSAFTQCVVPTIAGADKKVARRRFEETVSQDNITVDVEFLGSEMKTANIRDAHVALDQANYGLLYQPESDGQLQFIGDKPSSTSPEHFLPFQLAGVFRARIYFFHAERMNIHRCRFSNQTVLLPNATNLAEVVLHLRTQNVARAERFDELIHRVYPDITLVTSHAEHTEAQIMVWSIDPSTQRQDLANSLEKHGTGLGQVMAMLYVVLTAEFPQVIVIDEPQSFLHPGAVRELIEILTYEFPDNQYIVSSHSPVVVSAAEQATTLLVTKEDGESIVTTLDLDETTDLRHLLADVGARLSDVFGIDRILWVEGGTEEECFPLILRKHYPGHLKGTAIRGVRATGELQNKDAVRLAEIYTRLSTAGGLLPTAVGFVFDTETYSEKVQAELKRRLGGKAHFIPRRMYENYVLDAEAIAEIANNIDGFSEEPITSAVINEYLEDDGDWIKDVHGANRLAKIFSELSQNRVVYDKIRHGRKLTQWLVEHKPDSLRELADFLATVIDPAKPAVPMDDQAASRGS